MTLYRDYGVPLPPARRSSSTNSMPSLRVSLVQEPHMTPDPRARPGPLR